jgi:GNAT superfamily N-acetyltransferase
MHFVDASNGRPPADFAVHPVLSARAIGDATWQRDAADAHWLAVRDGVVVARASLWWTHVPSLPGQTLGCVGHYAAADRDAGTQMLAHAVATLAARGCTTVVGPLDGSTWRSYRLVTERGTLPPFFLEPDTPDDWPDHFRTAGFDVLSTYTSSLVDHLPPPSPRTEETAHRLAQAGYAVRSVDLTRAAAELDALYDVSMAAFAHNFLYTPIARDEFHAHYAAILPHVDPRLVLLAEHADRVVGYAFAVPDLLELKRTGRTTTAVLKTLAVDPAHAGAGLGGLLVERCQRAAEARGLTRIIHALMHETNFSQRISRHYGVTCRRYALFARVTS